MKLRLLKPFLLSSFLVFITACQQSPPKPKTPALSASLPMHLEAPLRINIVSEPQTLDPRKARSLNDINVIKMLMDGLTRVNAEGNAALSLAESYEVSEDLMTYTFHLKEAKWSNGESIKAQDFVYAWKKTLSPDFPSDNANMLYILKNARFVKEAKVPSSMLAVKAVDDLTLTFSLENPVPYLFELLACPIFFPVHTQTDLDNPSWALESDTYVGSGPFMLKTWNHQSLIESVKNPSYWDQKTVKLSGVCMTMVDAETGLKMFENKELDWEGSPLSTISPDAIPSLKEQNILNSTTSLGTFFIRTNVEKSVLSHVNVRKALALAMNRQDIVDHITHGQQLPATSLVPLSLKAAEEGYFKDADITTARNLLASTIKTGEVSPKELNSLTLSFSASEKNRSFAQAIQNQWKEALGIDVKLEALESKIFFDKVAKKDYQLAIGSWVADFKDPINFLEVFKNKEVGTNNTNWENSSYKAGLEESYLKADQVERLKLLGSCESILMNAMPIIPICHFSMIYVKDDKVKDVIVSEMGSIDFKWAYLEAN